MTEYYYEFDEEGEFIPHEYTPGNILEGTRSTLPPGKYVIHEGKQIRVGNAQLPLNYGGSDVLSFEGVRNPVDGKMYDSKSKYYRAVKDSGCEIMGNDAPKERVIPKTEQIDWKSAVAESIRELKSSPTTKGKKK